jgi:hypothetical protein
LSLTKPVTEGLGIWAYLRYVNKRFTSAPRCAIDLLPRPLWPWLDRRTPPAPPKLGSDDIQLLVDVHNWAVAQTRAIRTLSAFPVEAP